MKYLMIYLCMLNLLAFILMGVDKRRAKRGAWRVPERTLFLSAILGGSIGGWLGMELFRHKTKHKSFTIGFPCIMLFQIILALTLYYI